MVNLPTSPDEETPAQMRQRDAAMARAQNATFLGEKLCVVRNSAKTAVKTKYDVVSLCVFQLHALCVSKTTIYSVW